ncbi:MAG TPA: magnesium transporter CorA family protein [Actinocrinis sp.]|jgi:magnesium transporter
MEPQNGQDQDGRAEAPADTEAKPVVRSRAYQGGRLVAENFPMADLSDWIKPDDATVWLDLPDPTHDQLIELRDELGLHYLAIEDAIQQRQRPKLDRYEGHLLISAYAVRFEPDESLSSVMVLGFITPKVLVTVHHAGELPIEEVVARWDETSDLADQGVGFLLHGLIDYIADGYFDALQLLDDSVEDLSDRVFDDHPGPQTDEALRRTFELRRSLLLARHVITPMREVVNSLMRRDLDVVSRELAPYYQDVYDHVLRAAEWTDNLRDLIGTIRETHLTIQGNRMNLIMKKVTSWAAIIAVPTAVTGFYGQNVPYPGFGTTAGFWTSVGLMICISVALYILFRRRDWL